MQVEFENKDRQGCFTRLHNEWNSTCMY